jgi:hypothetical protein
MEKGRSEMNNLLLCNHYHCLFNDKSYNECKAEKVFIDETGKCLTMKIEDTKHKKCIGYEKCLDKELTKRDTCFFDSIDHNCLKDYFNDEKEKK